METKEYKLTDVCDFQGGTQPPKEEWITEPRDGYVRMLQIRDFTQDKAEHVGYVKDTKKLNKCEVDDILIGRYGASVGKILTGLSGAYNVAIIKTIPNEELLSKRYLYYVLTGTDFQNFILNIGARAAQAGFNKTDLSLFRLHIPSLREQERIADVLERTQNLISKRQKSINLLDEYLKTKFVRDFGEPNTNIRNFDLGTIADVSSHIKDGPHVSPDYSDNGVPILSTRNIRPGELILEDVKYVSNETYEYLTRNFRPQIGDVLVTKGGTTGFAKAVDFDFQFCVWVHIAVIRPNSKVTPIYLEYFFNSDYGYSQSQHYTRGVANRDLGLTRIANINIVIPPIELQKEFERVAIKASTIKNIFKKSLDNYRELYNSLSHKALKGELEIIEKTFIEGTIKVQPKITGDVIVIDKINKELEEFHKNQPQTGASDDIDNTIRQLEAELKIKGEIPFWPDYVKYRIVKGKFKEAFTFDQLWEEITKFPFETVPEYDEVSSLLFKWLAEENAFIRQQFNPSTKQIELIVNETAKA